MNNAERASAARNPRFERELRSELRASLLRFGVPATETSGRAPLPQAFLFGAGARGGKN
jgi:hypothetical protein